MMSRVNELNNYFLSELYNKKCLPKDLIPTLEKCEKLIINAVYEEHHGERLYLDNVIDHLIKLSNDRGLHDSNEIVKMIDMLSSFKKYIKDAKKGCKGERFAKNALKRLSIDSHILDNIQLSHEEEDKPSEEDLIVVNENGIFIIEVKYSDNDMCITRDGFYVPSNDRNISLGKRNILEQVAKERHIVRNILCDSLNITNIQDMDKKIHSIILFANRERRLFDESKSGNILFCHNLSTYISNFRSETKLTTDEINQYVETLKSHEINKEYTIDFDLDLLRDTLSNGLALLESKDKVSIKFDELLVEELDETPKDKWKFDPLSSFIGSLTTCATITCGYILFKKKIA